MMRNRLILKRNCRRPTDPRERCAADRDAIKRSGFTVLKVFAFLAVLVLSGAAFGQSICDSTATGTQPYSFSGSIKPQSAALPLLGYFATGDVYEPLPDMPTQPTSFCGPLWQANYPYVVGNMIEPVPLGAVFQAVPNPDCNVDCKSGSTQPTGFAGTLILPSNIDVEISTCSDPGTTATCTMIGPVGGPSPLNLNELYQGAVVGSTVVIQNYSNPAYNGPWVVTASTNPPGPPFESPFTFSFTASGLGSGDCTDFEMGNCIAYQQGTQITDGGIIWQYVGPQNEIGPVVVVTPSPFTITTAQELNVTVAVGGEVGNVVPTGTVTLTSGNYASAATTLNKVNGDGSATITIPAGLLAVGMDTLTATYSGDDDYGTAAGVNSVTVTGVGLLTPTVSVMPVASSITTAESLNVTITVSGGSGNPTPTGKVTLTGGGYTSEGTMLSGGSATITIPAGSLAVGTDTLTATYSGDSNYNPATGTGSVTVTESQTPTFSITGTSVSVSPGATTGNTSTITVTPSGGFNGSVTLTAAITSSPAGAQDLPTLSSIGSVTIAGTAAGTTTLTISTTAASGAALAYPVRPGARSNTTGGTSLVALALIFGIGGIGIPSRRRTSHTKFGMLVLLATLIGIGGLLACGGSGNAGTGNSGTTPGTYTITVTGISGSTTATGTVTLIVQ
jgi:hypothetical protein